jgi:hypothetical protein
MSDMGIFRQSRVVKDSPGRLFRNVTAPRLSESCSIFEPFISTFGQFPNRLSRLTVASVRWGSLERDLPRGRTGPAFYVTIQAQRPLNTPYPNCTHVLMVSE